MNIVTGSIVHLEMRVAERCYTMDEIAPCIVHRDGLTVSVDTDHETYPRAAKQGCVPGSVPIRQGVGTELKRLLARVGITSTPECKCDRRARIMDEQGIAWCEENVGEIVGWLREAASDRGLPFIEFAGTRLVWAAIAAAKARGT
jgi:hypothetical protein